ncbi:peptidylprolyl isomerase [Microbaculum sp. FT89]|uniref:peptidylprolyl isomerase n=1 Tax=Microbaculum sp. FT89 TaxID=3447298 RepID=UPI003F537E51
MRLFDVNDRKAVAEPAPAVRINGVEISRAAIAREIQNHPADTPGAAREEAARALAVRELLLQEARRRGIAAEARTDETGRTEADEEALVRALIEADVAVPSPTEAECRRFYDTNAERFRSADIYEAAHILFAAPREDHDAYDAADSAAREAIDRLRADPDRFATMAADLSACPSGKTGGNLGQISTGQTTPEFEAALAAMDAGVISPEPVHTPYGVHVVRLDRKIAGRALPFEVVGKEIADYLADAVFHRAVHQYIAILAGRAEIEGIDLKRAEGGLVQ